MSEEKLSILIVDDEQVVRESLLHWFTEEGYDVDSSMSAPDALAKLAGREFDLVIADIRMPGMDGLELLEKIRAEQLDTSVIVMTGYASVDTAVRALKHGAFDYITKPFDPDDLSVVVRNALEVARPQLRHVARVESAMPLAVATPSAVPSRSFILSMNSSFEGLS